MGMWVESSEHLYFDPCRPIYFDGSCFNINHEGLAVTGSAAVQLDELGRLSIVVSVSHPAFATHCAALGEHFAAFLAGIFSASEQYVFADCQSVVTSGLSRGSFGL